MSITGLIFLSMNLAAVFNYLHAQSKYSYFAWSRKNSSLYHCHFITFITLVLDKSFAFFLLLHYNFLLILHVTYYIPISFAFCTVQGHYLLIIIIIIGHYLRLVCWRINRLLFSHSFLLFRSQGCYVRLGCYVQGCYVRLGWPHLQTELQDGFRVTFSYISISS